MWKRRIRKAVSFSLGAFRLLIGVPVRILHQLFTLAGWCKFRVDFEARPDDVFVVTYPRSGTTWLQMILYQLATDGSMRFDHISQVVPYFERMFMSGRNPNAMASPRLFKSHLPWRGGWSRRALLGIPKSQGRYIYLVRDPTDVAVSYYDFHRSHLGYRGSLERFLDEFVTGKVLMGSWFHHVSEWGARAGAVNVLLLRYDELQQDLEGCVRRIAAFCDFRVPDAEWPRVLERCSFKFMKEHEAKFDHLTETLFERGQKMHSFLRRGGCGEGAERITAEQIAAFKLQAQRWGVSEYVA